jgi:hypothetical protein
MSVSTRKALLAACALIATAGYIQVAAQTLENITVSDPRPIAAALEALERRYGLAITYEDPEYVYSSDLKDVTALVRKDGRSFPRVIVPKGGPFQFQYLVKDGKPLEETTILIRRLLTECATLGGPVFDVQQRATTRGTEWHVIPVEVRDNQGRFVAKPALLDTPIFIPLEKRSALHVLSLICDELSRISAHRVGLGLVPMNPLHAYQVEMGAANQPARDVLANLLGQPMAWQLFYDPGLGWYALNIHLVSRGSTP